MLKMIRWRRSTEDYPYSDWQIRAEDGREAVFPTEARLQALFSEVTPSSGELIVKERVDNHIIVQAPPDLVPEQCETFLSAVWNETAFK